MISSARRDLPAPASPTIDTTPLWPVRTRLTADVEQRALVIRPTNGTSQRTGRTPARVGAGDQPRLLDLLAATDRVTPNGSRRIDGGHSAAVALADEHAARGRQRLQPRRRVHDVAHRRVVGAGERADEHLAGVDADAHLDAVAGSSAPCSATNAASVSCIRSAGPDGPLGVVLVGDRGAEQGDDGVAEQLVDAPAERLDVGDEALEARLDQALHRLGVEVLGQRRVADEVGEQDGDDAPLLGGEVEAAHRRAT